MLQQIYEDNAHKIYDIPPFNEIDPHYIRRMSKPFAQTSWSEFTTEIDREERYLAAQSDSRLPICCDDERSGWTALDVVNDGVYRQQLTELCAHAPTIEASIPGVRDVYQALMERLSWWYTIPTTGVEEKNADFVCYRLRCVLSGAGYENWCALAFRATILIPECPFDPEETEEKWAESLKEAHRACGWPTTLLWLDWSKIPDWDDIDASTPDWLKLCALAHLLKHVRRTPEYLHIVYKGHVEAFQTKKLSKRTLGGGTFWADCARVLCKPSEKHSIKANALNWAANLLAVDDLLPAKPLPLLPGSIISGPWSTLLPTYQPSSFLTPRVRLLGVWQARDGRVTAYEGDEGTALDWAWNTATASHYAQHLATFQKILPQTYPTVAPSRMLQALCPQWVLPDEKDDRDAYCAMVDAVLCAAIIRPNDSDLQREYPLVAVLPLSPSVEDSTNQGKGLTSLMLGGVFVPGITIASVPDSSSAPDSRALAADIERQGTIVLDEFSIPQAKSHVLSRDNLQSLCTGGEVKVGKVLANEGGIRLRHSLVLNAKWLDLSEDLINRTVPIFLNNLTPSQRAKIEIKRAIENGQAALTLRLAAVSLVEKYKLGSQEPPAIATPQAWRFTAHRGLAATILRIHNPSLSWETAFTRIDACRTDMGEDLRRHQQLADETGVSALTSSGTNLRVSWAAFWSSIDPKGVQDIVAAQDIHGHLREGHKYINVTQLLRARLESLGAAGHPFYRLLPSITGAENRVSNHAVVRSMSLGLRAFYADYLNAVKSSWTPMPGDHGTKWEICVKPRAETDTPSANTLILNIRLRS